MPQLLVTPLDVLQRRLGDAIFARVAGPRGPANRKRFHGTPGPRWFPADRPIRRVHGDAAMFVGGLRALLLQSMHPLAMIAVAEHSDYRTDPWGRLQGISTFLAATTYGTAEDAQRAVDRVRGVHRRITGTGPDGQPYRADDPRLLRWVHLAEIDSFLCCHQRYGARPLDDAGCDDYVADTARIAVALGVPDPPRTRAELTAALRAYRPELRATPEAREAARFLVRNPPLPPLARGPYALLAAAAIGELPDWTRRELRLPWLPAAGSVLVPPAGRAVVGAIRWGVSTRRLGLPRAVAGRRRDVDPVRALRQIAFLLERTGAPTYRVRAFRRAAAVVEGLPDGEFDRRVADGTLAALPGIGPVTAQVITEAAAGTEPAYLSRLLGEQTAVPVTGLRAALRGDCHTHSDWSDGGSPPLEMAEAARDLGHEWIALTDHSPRLTVAGGLSAARLRAQLELIGELNAGLAPFRILTGIEVDILEDGSLDQDEDLLARLDVVVASVHSKLRMPAGPMTERMVTAVRNPHVDVLGHCTGRLLVGRGRPESEFDAAAVFGACREHGVAVEINCRPERMDPPDRLLRLAAETGCLFAIDTDAHAPGQLDWLGNGTTRAEEFGIPPDRVINTRTAAELSL